VGLADAWRSAPCVRIVVANIWTILKSVTTTAAMSGLIVVLTIFAIKSIAARRIADATG
jgi:hypothetical protein